MTLASDIVVFRTCWLCRRDVSVLADGKGDLPEPLHVTCEQRISHLTEEQLENLRQNLEDGKVWERFSKPRMAGGRRRGASLVRKRAKEEKK